MRSWSGWRLVSAASRLTCCRSCCDVDATSRAASTTTTTTTTTTTQAALTTLKTIAETDSRTAGNQRRPPGTLEWPTRCRRRRHSARPPTSRAAAAAPAAPATRSSADSPRTTPDWPKSLWRSSGDLRCERPARIQPAGSSLLSGSSGRGRVQAATLWRGRRESTSSSRSSWSSCSCRRSHRSDLGDALTRLAQVRAR